MANPSPCQACLEVADAEFFVTNRLGVPWQYEQSTVALCLTCFMRTGVELGQALQAAMAELEAQATPAELKQIEANQAEDERVPQKTVKSRKRDVPEEPEANHTPLPEEAPATHD